MSGLIGYYVHHQGDGHRQRALAIASYAPERFVLLGTGLAGRTLGQAFVDLDDDCPLPASHFNPIFSPDCLHYAPQHHAGVQLRVAKMAKWIARYQPALMVIDVSVEVAMLARLASIPTVYVRLGGAREDPGHLQAFRAARCLMAPFHEALDDPGVSAWVRQKTRYAPGLSRARRGPRSDSTVIVVVNGQGGGILDGTRIAAAAIATPGRNWRVIGPSTAPSACPGNLKFLGWVDNADEEIGNAGIVVGTAGDGVVSAAIAAGRPFVCLPQARSYGEQLSKARRLAAMGAAVVLEQMPGAGDWPGILGQANALDPAKLSCLHDPDGLHKASILLQTLANQ